MIFCQENTDGSFLRRVPDGDVEWDETHLCPASALTPEEAQSFRVGSFVLTVPPSVDRFKAVREVDPVKVDGVWTQTWEAYDLPLSLDDKRAEVKRQADDIARVKRDQVVAGISPAEMSSWPIKRVEAIAYQTAGTESDAPNLALEAKARGVTLSVLAEKVMAKASLFASLEAAISGHAGALQDAAAAAQSEAELLSIDLESGWPV